MEQEPPTPHMGEPAPEDDLWLVSFSEDDDRELTTDEVVASLKRGEITLSSLVWREGMAEWQPIANRDELRGPAGLLMEPFKSDAPPARDSDAPESGDSLELSSSDLVSQPPPSLAEADFLGIADPDTSMAPPSIEHAAFFSNPPPSSGRKVLPALPALGGAKATAAVTSSQQSQAKSSTAQRRGDQSAGGAPWKWLLLVGAAAAAAVAGYLSVDSEPPPPPKPASAIVNRPSEPREVTAQAAEPAAAQPAATQPAASAASGEQPAAAVPQPAVIAPVVAAPAVVAQQPTASATTTTTKVSATLAPAEPAQPTQTAQTAAAPVTESKPATIPHSEPALREPSTSTAPFDKAAASAALSQAATRASACRTAGDPSGTAEVSVTFSPSGRVTQAMVEGPPFQGTPTGSCIARELRGAQVPAFAGDFVTVHKHVVIQ